MVSRAIPNTTTTSIIVTIEDPTRTPYVCPNIKLPIRLDNANLKTYQERSCFLLAQNMLIFSDLNRFFF